MKLIQNRKLFKITLLFLFLIPFGLGGCSLVDMMQEEPLPTRTPLPEINLTVLPTLPTLPPSIPTETPEPEALVQFSTGGDLFLRELPEQLPGKGSQQVSFAGTVAEAAGHSYRVRHASGVVYAVTCDDFCFYVNRQKHLTNPEDIKEGTRVLVFGVSTAEDASKINADAIAADLPETKVSASDRSDLSTLPYPFKLYEYELKSSPSLNPLALSPLEGSLEQNLKDRLQAVLSNRTNYIYGYYGETYSSSLEYGETHNRDPLYPTRAHCLVQSNAYTFYDFWFPYVQSPYFQSWGIMSYGGDWYLPIRMTVDIDPDPLVSELIYSDRTIMSQLNFDRTYGYYRSFGFSILSDNLFYFFENEKGYGFSLNRVNFDLGFDEIPFGMVDRYQELNPFFADDFISFLGRRGETWYYVELKAEVPENQGYYW